MAHPCDHYEKSTYSGTRSNLLKSPSTMNPKSKQKSSLDYVSQDQIDKAFPPPQNIKNSHAYILASNFIRENETWAIKSAYDYCLKYYSEFGLTKEIFALAVSDYIMSK